MNRRAAALLASLALLGGLALSAQSDDSVASEETEASEIGQEVLRLRQAIGALRTDDGAPVPQDIVESLQQLRLEIDDLLAFLAAQGPEVRADEIGGGEEPQSGGAEEISGLLDTLPEVSPADRPMAESLPPMASPVEPACAEFRVFDTNEDGVVSGFDRYWRYFRLWRDDGDGAIEDTELSGLYDAGVRELTTDLGTYRTQDGVAGDVLGAGEIRLDLLGKKVGVATLVIDADRLAHGGELELQDGSGAALSGLQALTSEMAVASADGVESPLSCAEATRQD